MYNNKYLSRSIAFFSKDTLGPMWLFELIFASLSVAQRCSRSSVLLSIAQILLSVAQCCSNLAQCYLAFYLALLNIAQLYSKIKLDNLGQYSPVCEWTVKASAKENELSFKNIQLVSTSVLKQQLNKAFCVFFVREFMLALLESFSKKKCFHCLLLL